jgi:negative regulator of sigma-B (phosphoserine phosphatase)
VNVEIGATVRPHPGETECGDAVVRRVCDDLALFGVIDALGHGPAAAAAARRAVEHAMTAPLASGLASIFTGLDRHLRGGRGAAALLCIVHGDTIAGCGVGNVELRAVGMRVPMVVTPGVLGQGGAARLKVFEGKLTHGGRLVLFSDGVSARLRAEEDRDLAPQPASASLLERWGRTTDDATVLVADVSR